MSVNVAVGEKRKLHCNKVSQNGEKSSTPAFCQVTPGELGALHSQSSLLSFQLSFVPALLFSDSSSTGLFSSKVS